MELDSGAAVSLVSYKTYEKLLSNIHLDKSTTQLTTYSGESIKVQGVVNVDVNCEGQEATVPLFVVEENGPDLFGHNWLQVFKLNWNKICTIHNQALKDIIDSHEKVFEEGLGTLVRFEAIIYVDPQAKPKEGLYLILTMMRLKKKSRDFFNVKLIIDNNRRDDYDIYTQVILIYSYQLR